MGERSRGRGEVYVMEVSVRLMTNVGGEHVDCWSDIRPEVTE